MPLALSGLVDLFEQVEVGAAALRADSSPSERGRAVLGALRQITGHGPAALAIDDVQWLDSASARALRFALRRLEREPVAVLLTVRLGFGAADPELGRLPRCETLELRPLGIDDLRRALGVPAISRPLLLRIHEVSGGNPLYAIELARGLVGDDRPYRSGGLPLPDSLQAAIAVRLERVPAELVPLLETVAGHGRPTLDELRETLPEANVDRLLDAAEAHGLLVVDDLEVRFTHPLLGSGVYGRMSGLARRDLHARLAERAGDPDGRARHLALSTEAPEPDVAALLEEAAERARRRGAPELAAGLARHSLRLTPSGDSESALRRAFIEIHELAAAGEVSRAQVLADRLVAGLPPGPGRAEALVQRALLEDDDCATADALLRGAVAEAGENEVLRGRALEELSKAYVHYTGTIGDAIECVGEAPAIGKRAGDARLEVRAATSLAQYEALAGEPRPERLASAIAFADRLDEPRLSFGARSLRARHVAWDGDLAASRKAFEDLQAAEARLGYEHSRSRRLYDVALIECMAGNLAAAEELARSGTEAAVDAEDTYYQRLHLHTGALVDTWLGRAAEARATAESLLELETHRRARPGIINARSVLGLLALSQGEAEASAREFTQAVRLLDEMEIGHPGAFRVLPDAAEALARSGAEDAAAAVLEELERQALAVDSEWAREAAARCRGVLLLTRGDAEAAAVTLEATAASLGRLGHRPEAARAVLAHGQALLRAGRRKQAADVLSDARDRFAAMGAGLWEARAAEEFERALPGRHEGELTRAERRVAALVADGWKNRDIGRELYMSVATVEAHLIRIYGKLDIRSRSDLARLVADGSLEVQPPPDEPRATDRPL
jgi:DNA-binding NarL/FixJ family response regulator